MTTEQTTAMNDIQDAIVRGVKIGLSINIIRDAVALNLNNYPIDKAEYLEASLKSVNKYASMLEKDLERANASM